jgi:energy-converting hydrogenase A subunit M
MNKRNKRRLDVLERVVITTGGQVSQNRAELNAIVIRLNKIDEIVKTWKYSRDSFIERIEELEVDMEIIDDILGCKEK